MILRIHTRVAFVSILWKSASISCISARTTSILVSRRNQINAKIEICLLNILFLRFKPRSAARRRRFCRRNFGVSCVNIKSIHCRTLKISGTAIHSNIYLFIYLSYLENSTNRIDNSIDPVDLRQHPIREFVPIEQQ